MNIYEKILALSKFYKISVSALEKKLELGNGTIKKWGNTVPSADRLAKVADFFDVSVDYLLGRISDEKNIHEKQTVFLAYLYSIYDKIEALNGNNYKLVNKKETKIVSVNSLAEAEKIIKELVPTVINYYGNII
jgi:transcriptional regulator with XRE-family HTH domain